LPTEPQVNGEPQPDQLEAATDQVIAACGGNARVAVKALIVANEQLQASVSNSYTRGSPRREWYD
jgi:hypothetical protein